MTTYYLFIKSNSGATWNTFLATNVDSSGNSIAEEGTVSWCLQEKSGHSENLIMYTIFLIRVGINTFSCVTGIFDAALGLGFF